jgi:membrane-associated phospholipid phosphatase
VAFSRIYTGVHYPGDVVAGAAVGALVGWATSAAVRRLRRDPSLRRSSPSGWLR